MSSVFIAIAVSLLVYILAVTLIPRHVLQGSSAYTRHMISRLRQQQAQGASPGMEAFARAQDDPGDNPLVRAFLLAPGMQRAVPLIQRAGLWKSLDQFVLAVLLVFLFMLFASARLGLLSVAVAAAATWALAWWFLKRRVAKRKRAFLDQFPDALDSIVRSVRAGYPLNNAITMVGDNMAAPVGPEFKRVSDEVAYGWTLAEALHRLSERIDEPDMHFFTVVLNVQQESGGNLSEVLSNLSVVLRQRKQLRLKIKALSAEGRFSAVFVGMLPILVMTAIYFVAPAYLYPLLHTAAGNIVAVVIAAIMASGLFIINRIVKLDI